MPPPERAIVAAAVAVGRALRERGLTASVDQELTLCGALDALDPRRRDHVYWAARAAFVRSPDELPSFERVFERFWAGLDLDPAPAVAEHGETDPRMPGPQHGGDSLPQFRQELRSGGLVDGQPARASQDIPTAAISDPDGHGPPERRGLLAAYSPEEVLTEGRPLEYASEELVAVRRLAEELRAAVPERRSRRLRPSRGRGRLDVRRTVGRSLATDGEPIRPAFTSPSLRPRRLLVLCDVSGSMERYSRALLAALSAVVGSGLKAETFVFATRLTRVTGPLEGRDVGRALEVAREAVSDWSGGTRIGRTLAEFNRVHGRCGLARGAIVIVVSDGWDRGDPDVLARELARIRLQCRRLVWLNPRPAELDGQPLAVGMRAALPYIDDFVAGRDPRAVVELARVIGGLGTGRPGRRQRPVRLSAA